MALQRIEIDKNKPLNPGDVIELEYKCTGLVWITSAQVAMIEWQCARRTDWEIISNSLPENNRITFKILIKSKTPQDPKLQTASIGVTALMVSAAIVAVGVIGWLTLDKIYQLTETPAGKIAVAGMGAAGIAVLIIALLMLFKK
jgi:uncharacterized membrane protein YidH (DUF202 family)